MSSTVSNATNVASFGHYIGRDPLLDPRRRLSPEQRLQAAVLTDALEVLRAYDAATPPHQDARQCVNSSDRGPFSFATICESIGLDIENTRRGLLAVADGQTATTARHG